MREGRSDTQQQRQREEREADLVFGDLEGRDDVGGDEEFLGDTEEKVSRLQSKGRDTKGRVSRGVSFVAVVPGEGGSATTRGPDREREEDDEGTLISEEATAP